MELRRLLATRETLLQQEKAFRATCRRQLQAWQAELGRLSTAVEGGEEQERLQAAQQAHDEAARRHRRLRQLLANRNREIQRIRRLMDDLPSRTELLQYERRFVELYDQVAAKTEETRKYFAHYNTVNARRQYLTKEESLIRSINGKFRDSMRSKKTQGIFLDQCRQILSTVRASLEQQEQQLQGREMARDAQQAAYQSLLEDEREYFRAVKEFQAECDKNDALNDQLEHLGVATAGAGGSGIGS